MTGRRLSAGAIVMAVAAIVLAVVVFRHQLWHLALTVAGLRVFWMVARHKLGMKPRRKQGRGLAELGLAAVGGAVVARRRAPTHACGQCGHPISAPSRAVYCSPLCRDFAAKERRKREVDARALAAYGDTIPWD